MYTSKVCPKDGRVLGFAFFILAFGLMAVDFFNPSLPAIQGNLHTDQKTMKNLIVMYMVVLGCAQFFYGNFSDVRGRKTALVTGLIIEAVGMLIAYHAGTIGVFYLARAITAVGAAACTVISRAMIVDTVHEPTRLGKAFSYFSMAGQLSPALAPVIGSWISSHGGWRLQFLWFGIAVIVSVLVIIVAMPETHPLSVRVSEESQGGGRLKAYIVLSKDAHFMCYSVASAIVLSFTFGYYSTAPFAFDALHVNPMGNSFFYTLYSGALCVGAFVNSRLTFPPHATYRCCLYAYVTLLLICSITHWVDTSLWAVGVFSCALGFICGIAAALVLTLSMTAITIMRGAASALQGALKMFFTGICLLGFDKIEIHQFTTIIDIFQWFALALLLMDLALNFHHKHTSKTI